MENVRVNLAPLLRFGDAVASDLRGGGNGPIRAALKEWAAIYRAFLRERFDRLSKSGGGEEWPPLARSTILARRTGRGKGRKVLEMHIGEHGLETTGEMVRIKTHRQLLRYLGEKSHANRIILNQLGAKLATARTNKSRAKIQQRIASHTRKAAKNEADLRKQTKSIADVAAGVAGSDISILRDTSSLFNVLSLKFDGKPGQIEEDIPFGVRVGYGGPDRYPDGTATIADIASFHQAGNPRLPQRKIIVSPDDSTVRKMVEVMQVAIDKVAGGTANA